MDWLEKLSVTLKAEAVQEKPKGWATISELSSALKMSYQGTAALANRKVRDGLWERQSLKLRQGGPVRRINVYKPK